MRHPPELRERARALRSAGYGYQEVADRSEVALTTAWRWTHDIAVQTCDSLDGRCKPMTPERRENLSRAVSRSMKNRSLGIGIWSPKALELLASRRHHTDVARRLGVSRRVVMYHRSTRAQKMTPREQRAEIARLSEHVEQLQAVLARSVVGAK